MIRSSSQLAVILSEGRTVARLAELGGGTNFRWVTADTNEPVHGSAIKALARKGHAVVIASDICGDPMQYAGAGDV